MTTIDLSTLPMKTANEVIKGYGAIHQDITIVNPDAKHYIAVGLTNPISIDICGSAGYFCGGLSDGPVIHVHKNVSWGVGDNMLSGTIIVDGNAGAIAGEALRGGNIVIRGNMGSRAGQVMKKGTLCCCGNSSFMAGYMMYGGRLIILGDSGPRVGENMAGGAIFVGGAIDSFGCDTVETDTDSDEIDAIHEFLDQHGVSFNGRFRKIVSAGKDLKYGKPEPKSTRMPFSVFSGADTPYWNEKIQQDIKIKSKIGRYRIRGYGTTRHVPHFSDLAFKKDIAAALEGLGQLPPVELRTLIGDRNGARAIDLSMPVMIAPMSFGALSPAMKQAIGIASRLSAIADNTGEGGMYSVERAEARQLIAQCLSGRLGWNIHDMKRSDGLELYISQGAKPGLGGQLMASKLTPEIAAMRGIPAGMDLRSPSRHPDILGGDDLIMKVQEFREAVGGRLPVSLKLGGGRTRDDVKIAFKDGLDFVQLDGLQGGTGAAGDEVAEYVGIPTMAALMEAMDGLEEIDAGGQLPIVLMGGIQNGVDAAKAIALGASAVAIGTGVLIAGGCTGCMACSTGGCPVGMATQDKALTGKLDPVKVGMKIHTYLEALRWQLAAITASLGYSRIDMISRDDLVALTPEAAEMTRLPYDPQYREAAEAAARLAEEKAVKGKETGSATYTRSNRRVIRDMANADSADMDVNRSVLKRTLFPRENPFPSSRPACLDDMVFLSAALTRLVIDPYREDCATVTHISRWMDVGRRPEEIACLTLDTPIMVAGFDNAPQEIKQALGQGLSEKGAAYIGRLPLDQASNAAQPLNWLQLICTGDTPDVAADGLIFDGANISEQTAMKPLREGQLIGLKLNSETLSQGITFALEQQMDFLLLDGSNGIDRPWSELTGSPDLTILRDALARLRELNREEDIALISFGGMRSGTDAAKVLAINCNAAVFSVAAGLAMGGEIENEQLVFTEIADQKTLVEAVKNWVKATSEETAIIARCTGKTSVHNLEPEDMRCISLATAKATGIPLASGQTKRDWF